MANGKHRSGILSLSLTQRVMGLIAFGLAIVGTAIAILVEYEHHEGTYEQTRQKALVFLHGLERSLLPEIVSPDASSLNQILSQAFASQKDTFGFRISRLSIWTPENNLVVSIPVGGREDMQSYGRGLPRMPGALSPHHITALMTGEHGFAGGEIVISKDETTGIETANTALSIPLRFDGEVKYILSADLDLSKTLALINEADTAFARTMFVAVGGGILVMLLLTWLVFRRWLLRPVNDITAVTTGIAAGDLTRRVDTHCCAELGLLSDSINIMADSIQALLTEQEEAYLQTLKSLAKALESKDSYTAQHSARVAKYSVMLGRHIGLEEQQLSLLQKGALMHDLGKIGVPDGVLNKPAKLTEQEYGEMKKHPVMTATIMKPLGRFKEFAEIAAWHHERWDGKGYPDGLIGGDIPLLARIVSIADTWDAMTGDRVYRKGMREAQALDVLKRECHSGQWDPELMTSFIEMVEGLTEDALKTVPA